MAEKIVWLTVTTKFLDASSDVDSDSDVVCVMVKEGEKVKDVSAKVLRLLNLDGSGYILQLRNSRQSLIPLNGRLEENSRETPYKLTVLKEYQTVTPRARTIQADNYSTTIRNQIQIFLSRISNLENSVPELKVKREERIKQEIHELEEKLNFLQKRFNEADQTEWTGILKKSPLW